MNRRDLLKVFGGAAGIPAVQSIERLELKPADTIVLTFPGYLSDQARDYIRQMFEEKFPGHTAIVLTEGATVKVLRKA